MTMSYNVLENEWIPCVWQDGSCRNTSVMEALRSAKDIHRISAEYAPMTAGIIFFLLALLYSSQAPQNEEAWASLWQQKAFDLPRLEEYLQAWHARFDLFNQDYPFYQDARIGQRQKDLKNLNGKELEERSIKGLLLHIASGNNATLFDHNVDDQDVFFTPAQITRLLMLIQAFSLGGMTSASISVDKYYSDAPHARGIAFLLQGGSLFETLMLNFINPQEFGFMTEEHDQAAWEKDDPFAAIKNVPSGIKDFLTWQSRRIKLLPEELDGKTIIKNVYIAPGLKLAEEWENPFFNINYPKGKKSIMRFNENKALWRYSTALLEQTHKNHKRFKALDWINHLLLGEVISMPIHLSAFGLCIDPKQPVKKKVLFYHEENVSYPAVYLTNNQLRDTLCQRCLDLVIEVEKKLWFAISILVDRFLAASFSSSEEKKADKTNKESLRQYITAEQIYYDQLEIPFYQLLEALPENTACAIEGWKETLQKIARKALEHAQQTLGVSASALMAGAQAARALNGGLAKLMEENEQANQNSGKEEE